MLVHTGQNYDDRLNGLFFRELGVARPDVVMNVRGAGFGAQAGEIIAGIEPILLEHRPDRLLDPRRHQQRADRNRGETSRHSGVPHGSGQPLLRRPRTRRGEPPHHRSLQHRADAVHRAEPREPPQRRVRRSARPCDRQSDFQVIKQYEAAIEASGCLDTLGLQVKRYFLVDDAPRRERRPRRHAAQPGRSTGSPVTSDYRFPVICSFHPRTRAKVEKFGVDIDRVRRSLLEPLGFLDFVQLERRAFCILSDSGTVQEEACIFGVPNVTLRRSPNARDDRLRLEHALGQHLTTSSGRWRW